MMEHSAILEGATFANVVIVRHNGMYGAEVITWRDTMPCVPCEFATLSGVLHAVEAKLTADASLRKPGNGG